jgi:hypothetical protein
VERAVDHRVAMDGVDAADQVHLMTTAADDQTLKALLPGHERGRRHGARPPGQRADQRNAAAHARGLDGLYGKTIEEAGGDAREVASGKLLSVPSIGV